MVKGKPGWGWGVLMNVALGSSPSQENITKQNKEKWSKRCCRAYALNLIPGTTNNDDNDKKKSLGSSMKQI